MEPIRVTCTMKVKANSVKQEYEKQDELKRSAMRAISALLSIPEAGKSIWIAPKRKMLENLEKLWKDTFGSKLKFNNYLFGN